MSVNMDSAGIKIKKEARQTYAVWEITLKCNLACSHCGSRAGDSRVNELSTTEALDLVHQMADLGIKEVSLIGGEAFMRPDWLMIAAEITRLGMKASMTTGGFGISEGTAKRMKQAGISTVSVSIDGLEKEHDLLRGKVGAWKQCFLTIERLTNVGINVGCNTQINRYSAKQLPLLYQKLVDVGARAWQLQLTVPMGNAADNDEMLLQPNELLDVFPLINFLSVRGRRDGLAVQAGNNIGYFGPYERQLRDNKSTHSEWAFYRGCGAGQNTLGIEADGSIKGCPSLPTNAYTGGNIRERSLRDIYENTDELRFNDINKPEDATKHLWGECATCEFAKVCRGGCNWTSHVFFGKRGNNPYCHHRAVKMAVRGKQERFFIREKASGDPFDHGVFDLVVEDFKPLDPQDTSVFSLAQAQFPENWLEADPNLVRRLFTERGLVMKQYVDSGIVPKEESPWFDKTQREALMSSAVPA
ncbi:MULTISPECIES: radical SAM protein [Pseudoalteromonas]|uniref:Radical SAM protein n=1 Tax=Pseudoalteromonas piscicida TaxID=43662 RepID=A0AAD0W5V6_PSEO7|nr:MULTISPECIES: radical SAM protein [Pseudoalteromonas]AXR03996.1 radical SAM protein [Pseudoalteromonas piscicida]MBR8845648.1 radical SAM protein [Pseudoalteromonas sp. JC3]MCF2828724.1 radical SAM protein [Pseudoalteromonas sp. OF5H-5]MCF2830785.1 radical SAM protein [Pseudoalteromonas sp. DL2-H6]MCF2925104.1 radical SAM protein [Pseudoalteromonas sp. DL2-H1]